ncbi:MAG: hypothetical protein ACXVEE_20850 [Polyangiales bacterium]
MRGVLCVTALALASACSSTTDPVTISVTSGLDGAPFDGTPAVTEVQLRVRDTAGNETTLARSPVASLGLDVPDAAKTGVGALVLAGVDGSGSTLVSGRTPPLDLSGLQSRLAVALTIMVQRSGTIARALNLDAAPQKPLCAMVGTRYLLVADAASVDAHSVDLLSMTAAADKAAFATAPLTVAVAGSKALAIDAAGKATVVDLEAQTSSTPTPPSGAAFADVVGGQVVTGEDGAAFIVGATRASAPTDVVLRLDADGTIAVRHLSKARTGAAATWATGRGLVVAYGTEAASIEILAPTATSAAALAFPDHAGAGVIAPLDATHLVRVDETGAAWSIDLGCGMACAEVALPWKDAAITPRDGDVALALEGSSVLLVRGGHVSLMKNSATKPLFDSTSPICAQQLSTGAAAIAVGGDAVLRTVLP